MKAAQKSDSCRACRFAFCTRSDQIPLVDLLLHAAESLPEPADYFAGTGGHPWVWPRNVVVFLRKTCADLQRRTFESRLHTRHVLVANLATAGTINIDGVPFPLRPGHVHLVFPWQFHTYHDVEAKTLRWLFVTFETDNTGHLEPLRHVSPSLTATMRQTLERVARLAGAGSPAPWVQRMQMELADLLAALAGVASRTAPTPARAELSCERGVSTLLQRIRSVDGTLRIPEIAAQLGLSESRLRSAFRQAFGLSLGAYLRAARLHRACAMLRDSGAQISRVALENGFDSPSAFSRAFKAWAGISPRTWKRRAHEEAMGFRSASLSRNSGSRALTGTCKAQAYQFPRCP